MIIKSKYISRFSKNFIWLFLFNNLGYLFSFLSLPLLISKYGLKEIGIVFTIQILVLAISLIANYSFVYYIPTVSKEISQSKLKFLDLWNLTLLTRLSFSIILSLISIIIVIFYFENYLIIWLFSLPILLPKIINPNLFCNAIEKNQFVFKIGFFTKLLFLVLIYFSTNLNLVNLFFGLSEFVVILLFLPIIDVNFTKVNFIGFQKMVKFLKQTLNLFLVNFFSLIKPASILPLITYLIGSEFATLYTLSEKIMNVIRGVSGAVFISFFPIYNKEKITSEFLSFKNLVVIFLVSLIATLVIWIFSPMLIYYLNNFTENKLATKTLQVLSLAIPMFFIIIPLFSYLLELKKWNAILIFSIVQLITLFTIIFIYHQNIIHFAMSFVVSEYVMLLCYFTYVLKIKNNELNFSFSQ